MPAHPHAALMLQYAQDAQETVTPWERWEVEDRLGVWNPMQVHPLWNLSTHYRRKPRTIRIGDHEVPEPERTPLKKGQRYYLPEIFVVNYNFPPYYWEDDATDKCFLARGLVHLTGEAAQRHARALVALTARE